MSLHTQKGPIVLAFEHPKLSPVTRTAVMFIAVTKEASKALGLPKLIDLLFSSIIHKRTIDTARTSIPEMCNHD